MHRQIYIETDRKIERCTDNSMHVQVLTYGINICTRAVIFGHIASQRLIHIRTTQHKQISLRNVRRKCCTRSVDFSQKYQKYVLRSKSRQVLTVHRSFQFCGNKFDSRDYKLSEWENQNCSFFFYYRDFLGLYYCFSEFKCALNITFNSNSNLTVKFNIKLHLYFKFNFNDVPFCFSPKVATVRKDMP